MRLLLDGQLAHVKRFSSVDGWFCVLEPQVPSCNCGAIVATFSHGAVVHAENGMEIVWKYLGNEETEIARVPLPAGDHNEATSTCRIGENPWPAGLYKVTLLANGVVLCTKDFEVK